MHCTVLSSLSDLPFYFIPGLKTFSAPLPDTSTESIRRLSDMDIMRGEETELAGIYAKMRLQGDLTFILPVSHMKYIQVNRSSAFLLLLEECSGTDAVCEIPSEIANSAAAYEAEWLYEQRELFMQK